MWLGPILALPVVIAVVAIAMLAGKGKGESDRKERSSGGAAMLQAEGARPTAQGGRGPAAVPVEASRRGAPARDPVEARASGADAPKARPSEESVWSAAKVGELVATCKSPKDARRLYDQATRLRGSKRSVDRREAIALYQAVLQCGHSDSGKRRYSAYGLSLIFRGMGDCVSSRSHWETHREMSQRANLRHERMPPCR